MVCVDTKNIQILYEQDLLIVLTMFLGAYLSNEGKTYWEMNTILKHKISCIHRLRNWDDQQ